MSLTTCLTCDWVVLHLALTLGQVVLATTAWHVANLATPLPGCQVPCISRDGLKSPAMFA